ncbi:hypothetical protein I3760_03G234700 [Carya illinoinensis]|nr:hypothetical protein I3760_03G234700 [Carya illinoinensis]
MTGAWKHPLQFLDVPQQHAEFSRKFSIGTIRKLKWRLLWVQPSASTLGTEAAPSRALPISASKIELPFKASTLLIIFVMISVAILSLAGDGVEVSRVLPEDFASANHLNTPSSIYEKAKHNMAYWFERLLSGPSPSGPAHKSDGSHHHRTHRTWPRHPCSSISSFQMHWLCWTTS